MPGDTLDFSSPVTQFLIGAGNAWSNFVDDSVNAIKDPVGTINNLAHAVQDPIGTINAIKDYYVDKSRTSEGRGEIAGDVAITLATVLVGGELGTVFKGQKVDGYFMGAGKNVSAVDSVLNRATYEKTLTNGQLQYGIKGNAQQILKGLTVDAKPVGKDYYKLNDGTIVGSHTSSTNGVPTIDINRNGTIYKIRVQQ